MKTKAFNSFLAGRSSALVSAIALCAAFAPSAHAASQTWGSNTTGNWSLGTNWVGLAAPGATSGLTNSNVATFNNAAGGTITIDSATQNIGGLLFSSAPTAYTIGSSGANAGNSLLLSSGGTINVTGTNAIHQTVNAPLVLEPATASTAGAYTIQNNNTSTGALIIGGNITGGTTTAGITLTLRGTNISTTNRISGVIANGAASGRMAVTKTDAGSWTLSGVNTYSGATAINGGTLIVNSSDALGDGSATNTLSIGAATLKASAGFTSPSTRGVVLTGAGIIDTNSFAVNIAGVVSGTQKLTKVGLGTLTLTGVNTHSAILRIEGGTLEIGGSGQLNSGNYGSTVQMPVVNPITSVTFKYNSTADQIMSGAIGDAGNNGLLVKDNTGTLTLSGTNIYGGTTTVNGGTLITTKAGALSGYTTASKVVVNGGTLGVLIGDGTTGWTTTQVDTMLTRAIKTSGALGIDTTNGSLAQWANFTTTNLGSALGLTKLGTNTLTLNQANTYNGATTVSTGTLALTGGGSIANSSTISVASGATLSVTGVTSTFAVGASQTIKGPGTILATGKTVVANGTLSPGNSPGTLTQDGGTLQLVGGGDLNWQIYDASGAAGIGYDTVDLINSGTLDLSLLTASSKYNINLWSLSGIVPDANGSAINFSNALNYSWTLFSTGTAITGFDSSEFVINTLANNGTTGFSNAPGAGVFSVNLADSNTDIVLTFTVPEPGTALIGSLGLLALLRRRRN